MMSGRLESHPSDMAPDLADNGSRLGAELYLV